MNHPFGREHVDRYRASDGEDGYIWKRGTKILILSTKGRRSGQTRDTPLIFEPDRDRLVIVASKGGRPEHPAWFVNMEAHPEEVEVQVKADRFKVRHRVAEGEERERLWKLMASAWPDYDAYQARTDRQIPVVILERRT